MKSSHCKRYPLALAWLVAGMAEPVSAQRAGLWEAQGSIDGMPIDAPVRQCRIAGAQLAALRAWPGNCVAEPLHHTASGIMDGARCSTGRAGLSLSIRRELIGDMDRSYSIATWSQVEGAAIPPQAPHRAVVMFRYLGSCAGVGNSGSRPDAAFEPMSAREPLSITLLRIVAPVVLLFSSIVAAGLFFRRRWRQRRDRATVANIVNNAAGDASVPVLVTYTGVRGLPWWYAIAMNNAKPLLVVAPDGICFRVVRRQCRPFSVIACLDVRQGPGTVNLDFTFHGSIFTFAANVGTVTLAAHVIASLPPYVPLSPRAQALKAPA